MNIEVARPMSKDFNKRCCTFFLINTPRSAATLSRPSNVFQSFGRRWSFIYSYRDLAHPSPKFHRISKSAKFGVIFDITKFEPPALKNAARYLNSQPKLLRSDNRSMSSQSLVKLGLRTPENRPKKMPHHLKWDGESELNRQ